MKKNYRSGASLVLQFFRLKSQRYAQIKKFVFWPQIKNLGNRINFNQKKVSEASLSSLIKKNFITIVFLVFFRVLSYIKGKKNKKFLSKRE